MKLVFVNNENVKNIVEKGKIVLLAGSIALGFGGCSREISTNANVQYDIIDTTNDDLVNQGIQQIIDVPGEDFKLVINYRCILDDNARWTVTSDKLMYMDVYTQGLDKNTTVYIDNVHIDTTIKSRYPAVDGITQDSMDDRIHNAQMIGFPISDDNKYININSIEGQNESFIKGSFRGFINTNSVGRQDGEIKEERYVESDYLKAGVYANKISSIIDLIIIKKDGTTTCVSVPSTIGVSVWPYIERQEGLGTKSYVYYEFNETTGKMDEKKLTSNQYEEKVKTYSK